MKPPMNTVQPSRNPKASPQRRREREGSAPWERTLPACPGWPTPCTQDACAPRSPAEENPWQLAKDFRVSGTENSDPCSSVFIGGFVHLLVAAGLLWGSLSCRPCPGKLR